MFMSHQVQLTAIYQSVEDGWIQAQLKELPGVITCARSRNEAKEMLVDAFNEYVLSLEQDAVAVSVAQGAELESVALTLA